jgi:glycerol-3-phosphate O-acyltransferase
MTQRRPGPQMNESDNGNTVPEYLRNGHFTHVAGILDKEPPWILRKLIPILSKQIRIDDEVVGRLRELQAAGPVVYAMKYRNIYDLHFLRIRFAKLGLPVPAFVFDTSAAVTGSFRKFFKVWSAALSGVIHEHRFPRASPDVMKEILENRGSAAVMFLVDEKTTRDRYVHPDSDPISILFDVQARLFASIAIVPLMILYDRSARHVVPSFWETFLGDSDNPGIVRRIATAFRRWTVPELLIGEPVHLIAEYEEFGSDPGWDELPVRVRQKLIDSINSRIRVNRGPEKLSRTEIKERVLQDARVQRSVREMASKEGETEEKTKKLAESYVDEIAANQQLQIHHFLYYVLRALFAKVFDGVDIETSDFSKLKKANAESSLIYVSCHKSHFDYLLVGYFSFINQMAIPYMAAGKNLSFWPIGVILRRGGAFFIRRTFRGLGLYTYVFTAYLKVLVREKVNINFYIEGARSRTGKLTPPRMGMLAFLLQTIEEGAVPDLTFVPTYMGYDRVPEEKSYLKELAGKEKEKESFWQFLQARAVLKKRFGKVYLRFRDPVSFIEFCSLAGHQVQPGSSFLKENRKLLQDFAYYLMYGIVRAGVVSHIDLTAAGLICRGSERITRDELIEAVQCLWDVCHHEGFELSRTARTPEIAVRNALDSFAARGFLEISDGLSDENATFKVSQAKVPNLDFYRNGIVNCVWDSSLLAMILLHRGPEALENPSKISEEFETVKDLLMKELIINPLQNTSDSLAEKIEFFRQQNWIYSQGESVSLRKAPLECLAGVLHDLLEIYYVALVVSEDSQEVSQKELMKKMASIMEETRRTANPRLKPALAAVPVNNALTRYSELGILEYRTSRKYLTGVADHQQMTAMKNLLGKLL